MLGGTFTIRTYHHSLKNLLKQVIQTPEQKYFLTKLLGFSYIIVYRKGRENLAADALSRSPVGEEELGSTQLMAITCQHLPEWLEQLLKENETSEWLRELHEQVKNKTASVGFSVSQGYIMFRQRYCLSPLSPLREVVLQEFHGSKIGGHVGFYRILYRVR